MAAGQGGVRIFALQICGKARFSQKNGKTPSDPAAPGFARIHRATSPINGGGKGFFDTLRAVRDAPLFHYVPLVPNSRAKVPRITKARGRAVASNLLMRSQWMLWGVIFCFLNSWMEQ